ncbi:helix-turn-helix domain-containing protein [Kangsaoukella pontilimi]|uniref:helix-turn-helix domain-containing protein n=1 Tax=Kangsaoukella pontilimi TaxID=2691042 RepID=UPI0013715038|nr:AraC family transcriptional regulator [Kangsaoukella pontilimi]
MPNPPLSQPAGLRAGIHRGALRSHVIGRAERLSGTSWLSLLIEKGDAEIRLRDVVTAIRAPAIVWWPWEQGAMAQLSPGAVGAHLLIGSTALFNAIGHKPESEDIRAMVNRRVTMPLSDDPEVLATFRGCFDAIHRESLDDRGAAGTLIEAYLHIVLIELWRSQRRSAEEISANSPSQRVFDQFRAMVEQHYRERWTVERYAASLGLSRDRLGDICMRVRGRTPKTIIDRRSEVEARLLLTNSTNSIEQIAGMLGFQSAAQFNRFFRRMTGTPPGRLRRAVSLSSADTQPESVALYEWP